MAEDTHKYDDIIHLSRPKSERHASMSMLNRGAQFSPFAALVGYEDVIEETARLTDAEIELDESRKEVLDRKLRYIAEDPERAGTVTIVFWEPDGLKEGGHFVPFTGEVRRVDTYRQLVIFADGRDIWIDNIRDIQGVEEALEE